MSLKQRIQRLEASQAGQAAKLWLLTAMRQFGLPPEEAVPSGHECAFRCSQTSRLFRPADVLGRLADERGLRAVIVAWDDPVQEAMPLRSPLPVAAFSDGAAPQEIEDLLASWREANTQGRGGK